MTGRGDGFDAEAADLQRVGPNRNAELAFVLDVIVVRMSPQHAFGPHTPAADRLEQRLQRRARVDEHRLPALLVGDEKGIRKVVRMHAPFDQHAR